MNLRQLRLHRDRHKLSGEGATDSEEGSDRPSASTGSKQRCWVVGQSPAESQESWERAAHRGECFPE